MIQSGAIGVELSDCELIYCSRKTLLLKLNENYEISLRSVKNHSDEIFVKQLRSIKFADQSNHTSIKFADQSNHTCVNDAYQDFVIKFLSVVDFVAPIRTLRV